MRDRAKTLMRTGKYSISLVLAASVCAKTMFAAASPIPEIYPQTAQPVLREPIVGVGYHPGNFIGPLAFDVILLPVSHVAIDLQVGTWRLENDVHGLGIAPQLQWEILRKWQTPYVGLAFRYEKVWSDGVTASSEGGFVVGGWQWRWRSDVGVLIGGGVLYKTAVTLNASGVSYWSSGGFYGTYEVGARYFF